MKTLFLSSVILFFSICSLLAGTPLFNKLQQIKEISDIHELQQSVYAEAYEFFYEQPIDHTDPSKGTFKQYVLLGHKDVKLPVVAILEGYGVNYFYESELSQLFNTNQIIIEHRFFNRSIPPSGIPWKELTLKQAATDQHRIIQSLRKEIYPETTWISTGVSKGGQTTIYHRYFYPDDVELSVPYVAPMNLAKIDPRLEKYLVNLGNTPEKRQFLEGGGKEGFLKIFEFQKRCFENLDRLTPQMQEYATDYSYTFDRVGGVERATKLVILEYPFAFWQWGAQLDEMPETDLGDWEDIFNYLIRVSPPDFFNDSSILKIQAFYYAALTETGMYAYNTKPFKKFFKKEPSEIIDFSFAMPEGYEQVPFNTKQLLQINKWLQSDAEKMLFIYGGMDPWAATAVDLQKNSKCRKFIKTDMHHGCRISHFDGVVRMDIVETLQEWITGK